MDQVAELFGTLAFGWCITHHGNLVVLPAITALALLALPFEIWAIQRVLFHCACLPVTQTCQTCHHCLRHWTLHTVHSLQYVGGARISMRTSTAQSAWNVFSCVCMEDITEFDIWHHQSVLAHQVVNCAADALTTDRAAAIASRRTLDAQTSSQQSSNTLHNILKGASLQS